MSPWLVRPRDSRPSCLFSRRYLSTRRVLMPAVLRGSGERRGGGGSMSSLSLSLSLSLEGRMPRWRCLIYVFRGGRPSPRNPETFCLPPTEARSPLFRPSFPVPISCAWHNYCCVRAVTLSLSLPPLPPPLSITIYFLLAAPATQTSSLTR
jgi:hypothetical protein